MLNVEGSSISDTKRAKKGSDAVQYLQKRIRFVRCFEEVTACVEMADSLPKLNVEGSSPFTRCRHNLD